MFKTDSHEINFDEMVQLSVTVFVVLLKNENCEFTVSTRISGFCVINLRDSKARINRANEEGMAREDYTSRDP